MLLAQISHIVIQGMADLELFKGSLTHRSTVGHPCPQLASRGLSPVLCLGALKHVAQERANETSQVESA